MCTDLQFDIPHAKLSEKLTPIERAKLDLANAYALNSIFFQYLATRGVSIKDHPLKVFTSTKLHSVVTTHLMLYIMIGISTN